VPDTPAAHGPGPKGPPPGRRDDAPPSSTGLTRSTLKTLAPLALGVLGLALLVAALTLYPRTTQRPAPSFADLYVTTAAHIASVTYTVRQVSPAIAAVRVSVNSGAAPHAGAGVTLALEPPPGTFFRNCPRPACTISAGHPGYAYWAKHLTFKPVQGAGWAATAGFLVKADHFGATSNGVNAYAAIPDVTYHGPGKPYLETVYHIPSAASYNWSWVPTEQVGGSVAVWEEPIPPGETAALAAVGINYAAQAQDGSKTFIAGALVALAGAAILTAVIEAMHVHDWAALRAQRHATGNRPGHPPA
jgi:hypothetical protein